MAEKKVGRGSITIDGEPMATVTFESNGQLITLRELSVDEGDVIWDASQEPVDPKDLTKGTKTNDRLNTRLLLAKASVDPVVTADQIGKWGGRKYTTVLRAFNQLNSVDEANPTPPAGSAEPTSPDGGESSPAI